MLEGNLILLLFHLNGVEWVDASSPIEGTQLKSFWFPALLAAKPVRRTHLIQVWQLTQQASEGMKCKWIVLCKGDTWTISHKWETVFELVDFTYIEKKPISFKRWLN